MVFEKLVAEIHEQMSFAYLNLEILVLALGCGCRGLRFWNDRALDILDVLSLGVVDCRWSSAGCLEPLQFDGQSRRHRKAYA